MGSIFQETRIREKKGRGGNYLVYQPAEPSRISEALLIHNTIYPMIAEPEKVPAKWMKSIVDDLLVKQAPRKDKGVIKPRKRDWEDSLKAFQRSNPMESLDYIPWTARKPLEALETSREAPQAPKGDPGLIPALVDDYNAHWALNQFARRFPLHVSHPEETKALIREILSSPSGSLMVSIGSNIPKPIYKAYREMVGKDGHPLLSPAKVKELSIKVNAVQTVLQYGELWKAFLVSQGLSKIEEVKQKTGESYQGWREARRDHGTTGRAISRNMIKKELQYFRNVCNHAQSEGLISFNPVGNVRPAKDNKDKPLADIEKPFTLAEWKGILNKSKKLWEDAPESNPREIQIRKERRLNWLTVLFLSCTGCRPKEVNQWSFDDGEIHFEGGKTKNANRFIKASPTLIKVINDPQFAENRQSVRIAERVSQYLRRNHSKEFTSYRFRHSVATALITLDEMSLAKIAFWMGHDNSQVTEQKYANLRVYRKDTLRPFWKWLNEDYLR